MKRLRYVEDQTLLELDGTAAKNDQREEVTWTQYSWLCGRVADPAFAGSKLGLEGLAFALSVQTLLSEQREDAAHRGYWLLEDEPAEALLRATRSPAVPYQPRFTLTIMKFAQPVEKMEPAEKTKDAPEPEPTKPAAAPRRR